LRAKNRPSVKVGWHVVGCWCFIADIVLIDLEGIELVKGVIYELADTAKVVPVDYWGLGADEVID
jgi:hypothetical protein